VVQRVRGVVTPQEIYRDEALGAGHAWPTAEAALAYAVRKGRGAIRTLRASRPPAPAESVAERRDGLVRHTGAGASAADQLAQRLQRHAAA
jgi:hypothetical protein